MAEDRLDRIERTLDRITERHNNSDKLIANFAKDVTRNAEEANKRIRSAEVTLDRMAELLTRSYKQANERMDRTDKQIAQLSQEDQLPAGSRARRHTSQSTPPASIRNNHSPARAPHARTQHENNAMTNKTRSGRPPLPPGQTKTKTLLIKMTPAEHQAIMQLANLLDRRACGEIMRTAALNKAKRLGIHINADS